MKMSGRGNKKRPVAAMVALLICAAALVLTIGLDPGTNGQRVAEASEAERTKSCSLDIVQSENLGHPNRLNGVVTISADNAWAVGDYDESLRLMLVEHWNGDAWVSVPMSDTSHSSSRLEDVDAAGANDVWAVGNYRPLGLGPEQTLAMHWDGAVWTSVNSPSVGIDHNTLVSVTAIAANDVWAVGSYLSGVYQTLILHWDGIAWSVVPSVNVGGSHNFMGGITAVSANDVWAVGYYDGGSGFRTLTQHWNGIEWSLVPSPSPSQSGANVLTEVTAIAANNVWAVGYYHSSMATRTLIEQWNGTEWSIVASPNVGPDDNWLYSVSAAGPDEVWAVGSSFTTTGNEVDTLIQRWDGTAWSVVPGAALGSDGNDLLDVSAGPGGVWAVGYASDPMLTGMYPAGWDPGQQRTLAERWNGAAWEEVITPNLGVLDNRFYGIAAIAPDDIWAVGSELSNLIEHWDGRRWRIVPAPEPAPVYGSLKDVDAVSTNDVWAVGLQTLQGSIYEQTQTIHWNGSAWSLVSSPNVGTRANTLNGVAAVATDDVWAVGYYRDPTTFKLQTLIEHWNGTAWTIVPSPNQGTEQNVLGAITAIAANDIWAVGYYTDINNVNQSLVLHWDGALWSVVAAAQPGSVTNLLVSVSAISANDVWAVGGFFNADEIFQTQIQHWDGTAWGLVPSPNVGSGGSILAGVTAASSNDVWAVGYSTVNGAQADTLVEHWDGTAWSVVPSPNLGQDQDLLYAVEALGGSDVWAVGYSKISQDSYATLVERYSCACAIEFPDVPQGSTFYDEVMCLACRGIVSGLPNGTFGPGNPVTRGQLAKIVSNSAGYSEPHSDQSFEDVSVGSTFHEFVERLFSRGYIAGYECGGTGEPCNAPGNRPYFRPNGNITRGQASKIVASARGLPAPQPGQQTFEDVEVGSTFWEWIEALAASGAITGYPCGGPGEPCVEPENRYYFRPASNVTRGQSAKIVSYSFFPDCGVPQK